MRYLIYFISITLLVSCSVKENKKIELKYVGGFGFFYNGDSSDKYYTLFNDYKTSKIFPIDSLSVDPSKFKMNDSVLIIQSLKIVNGEYVCCSLDTLDYFIENINNKNYLIVTSYTVSIWEIIGKNNLNNRNRENIEIPSWGVKIGSIIPDSLFEVRVKNYIETKSINQIYKPNEFLKLGTIQLKDSNHRIVTRIETDISESDFQNMLKYFKENYPLIKIEESLNGVNKKVYKIETKGIHIEIEENITDNSYSKYSFSLMDDYILSKLLLNYIGKQYTIFDQLQLIEYKKE